MLVLIVFIFYLSFSAYSSVYNGMQQILVSRSDELINIFSSTPGNTTAEEFNSVCRAYIENFPDKNEMEIMSLSASGNVLISSTGFAPDQSQEMPDFQLASSDEQNTGYWVGTLDTGEKIMAVCRVVENSAGATIGAVRYLVSMDQADSQVMILTITLIAVGLIISLSVIYSGIYFIRSIVTPVRDVTTTAREIAQGDFNVRLEKKSDDELGHLVDTINDMAIDLGTAERMKNDFISSVSHELRTPLTSIKGWAETLHSGETDKITYEKGMNVIINESERLTGIVEDLLDFSRIQSGRMSLSLEKTDVLAELDEAVYMFSDRARTENKKLIYTEIDFLPPIIGDIKRLRQVFINILDNAFKYTNPGGVIRVTPYTKNGFVRVSIEDTGCGIAERDLPNIKKKFYKANQLVKGSGIGLAVADEIVEMHGGKLTVKSIEGKGTTVVISVPSKKKLEELNLSLTQH